MHPLNRHSMRTLPLTGAVMLAVAPAIAADVTGAYVMVKSQRGIDRC
jgi:hypothetical protein